MFKFFKKLFSKQEPQKEFSSEEYDKHYEQKQAGLEKVLGPMHNMVGHAIIPFQVGGAVDMYYFPKTETMGTGFVTMELIEPDGSGPKPNRTGTFELVAFTNKAMPDNEVENEEANQTPFNIIERRICGIFTGIGNYSYYATLQPGETCELPREGKENICLIFDEYKPNGIEFYIGETKHGLLLCIEIFRSEMKYAMENGSQSLFTLLKEKNYYPYSDLDRVAVI